MGDKSNYNSTFEKLAGRLTNIVLLGFFTTLLSLPVVTLGAAFTALNVATKAYLYEDDDKPLRIYSKTFKERFMLSTKVWLLHIVAFAVLIWDYAYYRAGDSTIDILSSAGIFVLFAFLVYEVTMVFIVIGEGKNDKVFGCIKTALDISMYSPFRSLMIMMLEAAAVVVALFLFRGLLLVVPGIGAYLAWQIVPEMLKRYKFRNS